LKAGDMRATGGPTSPGLDPVSRSELFGVAWFTLLFVAAVGIANGDANQSSYLLPGLRMADPGFLPGDWYTWNVTHSQWAFSLLVAGLAKSGFLELGLTLGAVVQNSLFCVGLYYLLRVIYDRPVVPWAAALALFAALGTASLGNSRWVMPFLEASSLSGVALVLAMALLARQRVVLAGLAFGLAGLLHEHFVILCLPLLAAATLVMITPRAGTIPWKKLGGLWGMFILVSAPTLFTLVQFAAAPGTEEIRWLTASLFPYHVDPSSWKNYFYLVFAAALLVGSGGVLLHAPRWNREIAFALGAIVIAVSFSLLLAYSPGKMLVMQVWPWRLSALVILAGLVSAAAALAAPESWRSARPGNAELGFGLLLLGVAILAREIYRSGSHVLLALCALPLASWASEFVASRFRGFRPPRRLLMGVIVTVAFMPVVAKGLRTSHFDIRPEDDDRFPLYAWVRAKTPKDAVFTVPPRWEDFRLNARRPLLVDWKSIPRYAPNRIEWLERIRALTEVQRPGADAADLDVAYATMDCERAETIRRRFHARFVIHERPKLLECGRLVYEDARFRVWDLAEITPTSSP
jgi:hypothetical protein